MPYLGSTPTTQSFISGTDYFNGTGSQTAFTLTRTVASVNDIEAVVNNVVQQPNDAYNISGTTITFTSPPSAGTNNVYVRYLSTTTQAITPSQNTVNYNTFDSNMQSAIGTGNKNRIINGAMVIDQRNAGALVSNANAYTLDRWRLLRGASSSSPVFNVQQSTTAPPNYVNSLSITVGTSGAPGANNFSTLFQIIEGFNVSDLAFGTAAASSITLSFWVRSSVIGTFGVGLQNSAANRSYIATYTINAANTWEQKSVTIAGDTTGTWLTNNDSGIRVSWDLGVGTGQSTTDGSWQAGNFLGLTGGTKLSNTGSATMFITGVQLEKGTQATSFEYRQYQQELALCQRYCYANIAIPNGVPLAVGQAFSSTSGLIGLVPPVPMRSTPTLSRNGLSVWNASGSDTALTAMVINPSIPSLLRFDITVASGLSAGNAIVLQGTSPSPNTGSLILSAEL